MIRKRPHAATGGVAGRAEGDKRYAQHLEQSQDREVSEGLEKIPQCDRQWMEDHVSVAAASLYMCTKENVVSKVMTYFPVVHTNEKLKTKLNLTYFIHT